MKLENEWWSLRWNILLYVTIFIGMISLGFASYYYFLKEEKVKIVEVEVEKPVIIRQVLQLPCEKSQCFQFDNISVSWDCVNSNDFRGRYSHFVIYTQNPKADIIFTLRLKSILKFVSDDIEVQKDENRYKFAIPRKEGDFNSKYQYYCNIDKTEFETQFKSAYYREIKILQEILKSGD